MLCDWLLPKYNKEVRTKPPTQRNQYGIIGLERSIYLALKHLHTTGKTRFGVYQTTGKKISGRTEIINAVRSQQQIMDKVREKIPLEKINATTIVGKEDPAFGKKFGSANQPSKSKMTRTTSLTKSIKTIKGGKTIKSTKSAKTTKKI